MTDDNDAMGVRDLIYALPKAELHIHVEATLEPQTLLEIAERNRITLPYRDVDEVRRVYDFKDLRSFLEIYYRHIGVLTSEQDFYDLAVAYAAKAKEQGVRRFELFFDPQAHTRRGVPYRTVIEGLASGVEDAARHMGVSGALIMCILRDLSPEDGMATLELALADERPILGIGLDSAEVGYPPSLFAEVYERARAEGLHLVAHAGEEGPPPYVWEALEVLGVERIDHGVRSERDPELMSHLAAIGMPVTTCPLSNVRLRVFDRLEDHNVLRLLEAGLKVSINADGPAYFGGYVGDNYLAVRERLKASWQQLYQIARNSLDSTFMAARLRADAIRELDEFVIAHGLPVVVAP